VRRALVALPLVLALAGCGLDDDPEARREIESLPGVLDADLEGGYDFAEHVHLTLDGDLDAHAVRTTLREVGRVLDVERDSSWAAARLVVVREDEEGRDRFAGGAEDLGDTGPAGRASSALDAWTVLAVCDGVTLDWPRVALPGDEVRVDLDPADAEDCLGDAPDALGGGLADGPVVLAHDDLSLGFSEHLPLARTLALYAALVRGWQDRDDAFASLEVTPRRGGVVLAAVLDEDARAWTPAADAPRMAATLDPLARAVAEHADAQSWLLTTSGHGVLADAEVGSAGLSDHTERPGSAAWRHWLRQHLADLVNPHAGP